MNRFARKRNGWYDAAGVSGGEDVKVHLLRGENEAIIGVIGFALMQSRMIVLRHRRKSGLRKSVRRKSEWRKRKFEQFEVSVL